VIRQELTFSVNGVAVTVAADPETPLLTALRNDLGLTGSRFGCGLGLCGACFVQVDGEVVPSCDTPLWAVEGRDVVTVEGLGVGDRLHPVQQSLLDHQAAQCGFCISGIAVNAAALLGKNPRPDRRTVTETLDRNLCRCGVQRRIVDAVLDAAGRTDGEVGP
jgi:nicotinate dehydrogenase subunit A